MINNFLHLKGWVDTKTIEVKGVNALVRLETSDEFVIEEIFKRKTYNKLNILPQDIVLDIGLNIGAFTILALQKGAVVHSYEAEEDNFKIAQHNIKINNLENNYTINNKAIIGNDDKVRPFSINVKRNKGAHSLVAKRGRDTVNVNCININEVLEKVKPTIIKMDIEGGEYECLKAVKSFKGVKELILEFHHAHLNDIKTRDKYKEIISILKNHFKEVSYKEEPKGAWVTLIYCKNDS